MREQKNRKEGVRMTNVSPTFNVLCCIVGEMVHTLMNKGEIEKLFLFNRLAVQCEEASNNVDYFPLQSLLNY